MIGPAYNADQLSRLYLEGRQRYAELVPPGYMDQLTKPEPRRYGDLIIWKQLIDYSRHQNRPVMFITDDVKEDWWFEVAGGKGTRTPHPKLRQEFVEATGNVIWFYEREHFLREAKKRFNVDISEDTIREVEEISEVRRESSEAQYRTPSNYQEVWKLGMNSEAARLAAGLNPSFAHMEVINSFIKPSHQVNPFALQEQASKIMSAAYPWVHQSIYKSPAIDPSSGYPRQSSSENDSSREEDSVVVDDQQGSDDVLNQDLPSNEDEPQTGNDCP